jgi:hypothetical protein
MKSGQPFAALDWPRPVDKLRPECAWRLTIARTDSSSTASTPRWQLLVALLSGIATGYLGLLGLLLVAR